MTVAEIVKRINGRVLAGGGALEKEVSSCYMCDLLSYVIGRAKADCAWVTIMTNVNVLAVASLVGAACVVISEGNEVAQELIVKADELQIPLIVSDRTSYGIARSLADSVGP